MSRQMHLGYTSILSSLRKGVQYRYVRRRLLKLPTTQLRLLIRFALSRRRHGRLLPRPSPAVSELDRKEVFLRSDRKLKKKNPCQWLPKICFLSFFLMHSLRVANEELVPAALLLFPVCSDALATSKFSKADLLFWLLRFSEPHGFHFQLLASLPGCS